MGMGIHWRQSQCSQSLQAGHPVLVQLQSIPAVLCIYHWLCVYLCLPVSLCVFVFLPAPLSLIPLPVYSTLPLLLFSPFTSSDFFSSMPSLSDLFFPHRFKMEASVPDCVFCPSQQKGKKLSFWLLTVPRFGVWDSVYVYVCVYVFAYVWGGAYICVCAHMCMCVYMCVFLDVEVYFSHHTTWLNWTTIQPKTIK